MNSILKWPVTWLGSALRLNELLADPTLVWGIVDRENPTVLAAVHQLVPKSWNVLQQPAYYRTALSGG